MSVRVVHTFGRNAGLVQDVAKSVVRFGRAPDSDILFDAEYDRDASGHHAEARFESGQWVLVDLDSRNGTFVRGARVRTHVLAAGDEITFGAKGPRVRIDALGEPPPKARAPEPRAPTVAAEEALLRTPPQAPHAAASGGGTAAKAPAPPPAPPPPPPSPPPPGASANPRFPSPGVATNGSVGGASPSPPSAGAPSAGKRVGHKTIAMMISSAVEVAAGRARPRKTAELSALVDQHVSAATAGQRRTTYLLAGLIVLALAGLTALILWSQQTTNEITELRGELARLSPDDPRRRQLESRLGTLHPSNANYGRNLYEASKKGIFMLASGREGFCTAFAVRPTILATSAGCIAAARRKGGRIVALENEGRGQVSFTVSDMKTHAAYRASDAENLAPDVGVFTISGRAAVVLNLATAKELATAGAGDDVYLIGFPGRLMDASNPAATFLAANIGRITSSAGRPAAHADAWLIQHDAGSTQGMNGSPIFNGAGKVIAINAGAYTENDDQTIAGRKTEVVRASPYKFAMRVDLLDAILR
jgi:pSer/pThr/pTyr-binding forkhead associated (FHA) protein/S1-C subfamily serine protease